MAKTVFNTSENRCSSQVVFPNLLFICKQQKTGMSMDLEQELF